MSWFGDIFQGATDFLLPGTGIGKLIEGFTGKTSQDPGFGEDGIFNNPQGAWDKFKNGQTNDVNKAIADENLQYQRERNEIEDARYEEETAYNRAFAEEDRDYQRRFAEEERDYQRALQQEIFNREDTALERQASSLSAMGINPASQNMNGLGAGQALSSPAPTAGTAPSSSSRGGTALHNDFQMQDKGVFQALSPLLSLATTLDSVSTGQLQRDSLALQNDYQFLDNLSRANKLGIKYRGYIPYETGGKGYRSNVYDFKDSSGTNLFDNDLYKSSSGSEYRLNKKLSMPDWQFSLDQLGSDDVYKSAERALTKMSNLWNNGFNNLFDKKEGSSVYDLGKNKDGKFNPFNFLLNVFGF